MAETMSREEAERLWRRFGMLGWWAYLNELNIYGNRCFLLVSHDRLGSHKVWNERQAAALLAQTPRRVSE